jgi:hypothetical protein
MVSVPRDIPVFCAPAPFGKCPFRVHVDPANDGAEPWGGFKYSGVGREYAGYGIQAFVETRAILDS